MDFISGFGRYLTASVHRWKLNTYTGKIEPPLLRDSLGRRQAGEDCPHGSQHPLLMLLCSITIIKSHHSDFRTLPA